MDTVLRCLARIDRVTWLLIAAFAVLGSYLLWDRGGAFLAAVPSALFWLVILACPLMHLFMHRHGGHGHGGNGRRPMADDPKRPDHDTNEPN